MNECRGLVLLNPYVLGMGCAVRTLAKTAASLFGVVMKTAEATNLPNRKCLAEPPCHRLSDEGQN